MSPQQESLKTLDPTFKGATFAYLGQALMWNKQSVKNFTNRFCPEIFLLDQRVFYFSKDFYLIEEINHQISALNSNGIMMYLNKKYVDIAFYNMKPIIFGPHPITFQQISGIFYVCGVLLVIAKIVFVAEIIGNELHRKANNNLEYIN